MTDITRLAASDLSRAIHRRRLSCAAVMEAYLERIGRLNGMLNAIVSLRPQAELFAEARAADAELAEGRTRGWMHGFPIAIKDLSEASGLACTRGSRILSGHVSACDDIHVARIRRAGAIVVGKTNTPEFGLGSHTVNTLHGATRNPHDPGRSAGGSSGGAAAAVAARLLPVADGSDMMGSLRNPAAFNNIVGFRPSFGRVPSDKNADLFIGQLSVIGPMARNVTDAALLLATQAGHDRRDPLSLPDEELTPRGPAATKGLKIAWLGDFGGHLAFEDGVLDLDRKALAVLDGIGCGIDEIAPDFDMAALWQAWVTLRSFGVSNGMRVHYDDPERRALLNPQCLWEIENGLCLSAADVYSASVVRSDWYRHVRALFARYDYLVLPAAQLFPFDVTLPWPGEIAGRRMDTYHRWMEVVIGPSMAGLPVAAMPAGFGTGGLPNGVQIVGPPRADRATLEFALAYEQAAGIDTDHTL